MSENLVLGTFGVHFAHLIFRSCPFEIAGFGSMIPPQKLGKKKDPKCGTTPSSHDACLETSQQCLVTFEKIVYFRYRYSKSKVTELKLLTYRVRHGMYFSGWIKEYTVYK